MPIHFNGAGDLHHRDSWYEGSNNWNDCNVKMAGELGRIRSEFSGQKVDRPYFVQPSSLDKAKDAVWKEAGEPNALKKWEWQNPLHSRIVTDYFWDHDFPGDNTSWYRGQGADSIEDYRQPVKWCRLSDLGGLGSPYVPVQNDVSLSPPPDKIYQGCLEDFYLVQACYALSMKPHLIRAVFADCEFSDFNRLGMYNLRFYKNSQFINVSIDDLLPFDKDDKPLCCRGTQFPSFPWPALIEKGYAKLHRSWEAISGGGTVEEALVDLTGGCSGRFHSGDCASDRMWKYFQELQRTTIWAVGINERECSKRLIPLGKHYAAAVHSVTQYNNVPYIGVFTTAPFSAVKHFPMCRIPMAEGYDYTNGFMWLRADDFGQLFDAIYECRLVNSEIELKEPIPRGLPDYTPGYRLDAPWYELIFAYDGYQEPITAMNCPSFLIDVPEGGTEIILNAGQTCNRFPQSEEHAQQRPEGDAGRHEQAAMLVRFFECSRDMEFRLHDKASDGEYMASASVAGEIYMVHMSAWSHTRDAMCCVKVLRPGRFVAIVSMTSKNFFDRMTFRCYSSKRVGCRFLEAHRNMIAVNPGMPLSAIPYSLTGIPRIDEYCEHLPRMFDDEEGKGKLSSGPDPTMPGWQQRVRRALEKNYGNDEPRSKTVGEFGGPGGGGSTNAVEHNSSSPCAFM